MTGKVNYRIYTDGSARANGNGGVGIVWIKNGKKVLEYSKGFKNVTNNKMELYAIFIALNSIKEKINSLEIITDSEYCIGVITKPWTLRKNIVLIKLIKKVLKEKQDLVSNPIAFIHTRGHQKDDSENTKWNNRCDLLAQQASDNEI